MAIKGIRRVPKTNMLASSKWRRINKRLYVMDNVYKTRERAEERARALRKAGYIAFLGEWQGKHVVLKRRKGTAATILRGIFED